MDTLRELGNVGLAIGLIAALVWLWMVAAARKDSGVGTNPNVKKGEVDHE